jgi:hypothetical protein
LAQPQAGSAAQPQAGSAAQPQAGSQHVSQHLWHNECRRQWSFARQSRNGVQRFLQQLSQQVGVQPQLGSAAQPQAGSAAQPQAGSAAAQVASQQAGVSQQPPIMRFSKPNALASEDATKRAATATTGKIIRFMGRTPVPLGKRIFVQQVTKYRLQLSEVSSALEPTFPHPE